MTVRLLVGDVRDRIREIPDGTIDLVCTSPPFLALRKYGDNPDEMGSEGTPADFLDALLELTQEFRRVLAPHGSIAIELGDTYSGSGGAGGDYGEDGLRAGQARFQGSAARNKPGFGGFNTANRDGAGGTSGWPLSKSLVLAPGLYAASLAYGRNLLNPDHTFAPWRIRNIITWCRPNPPVGALGDKVRPATSYITVACTSGRRYFDLDGVRTEAQVQMGRAVAGNNVKGSDDSSFRFSERVDSNPAGAPPLDWWDDALDPDDPTDHLTIVMPTQPYPGAHYATWPAKLAQRLIDMMCPLRVCRECGRASERIVTAEYEPHGRINPDEPRLRQADHLTNPSAQGMKNGRATRVVTGSEWSDCGCKVPGCTCWACAGGLGECQVRWRPGHTLDPFAGSGTTLAVASGMGRDATGIELYPANADLIAERVGMFLEVA